MTLELILGVGVASQDLTVLTWLWVIAANPQQKVWVKWRLPQDMKEQTVDCLNINNAVNTKLFVHIYNVLHCSWAHQHASPFIHIYAYYISLLLKCEFWDHTWWGKILYHNNDSTIRPLLQRETKIIRDSVLPHNTVSWSTAFEEWWAVWGPSVIRMLMVLFSIQHVDGIINANVTNEACCGSAS